LVPSNAVSFAAGSSAGKCNMTINPAANQPVTGASTTSDITVKMVDASSNALSESRTFTLTVNPVNDEPTISTIASQVATEDTAKTVSFTINDVDGPLVCNSTYLLALSTDSSKVTTAGSGVTFAGTYPNCVATINPVANANGTTFMTFLVQDGTGSDALSSSRTFQLAIAPVNDAPTVTSPGAQSTNEDTALTVNITMYDVDNTLLCPDTSPTNTSSMTITSNNTTVLPNGNIAKEHSGSTGGHVTCAVTLTPSANASNTTAFKINLDVYDGQYHATTDFNFTVNATNDLPTMSAIATQTTNEDQAKAVTFTISDVDLAAGSSLSCSSPTLSYTSSNGDLVAASGAVVWSGSHGSCTATVTPTANAHGNTNLTFTVNDGANGGTGALTASQQFQLTVNSVNDAPTITLGTLPSVNEDPATAPVVPFTVNDIDGGLTCNSGSPTYLTYESSDITKIASTGAVTFAGTYPNCTATVTLLANANGTSPFKIIVNDNANGGSGALSAEQSVSLSVTAVNDTPTGTPTCDSLSSGNVFRTGSANGAAWSLGSCAGVSDIDGDPLTYRLDLVETGSSSSSSYPCPTPLSSSAGGTSISGNFPSGANVYGSCRYLLKACDGSASCTAQSSNSVIISSYQLTVGTPTTPTLSSACLVGSSGSITASANLSSVTWSASTSAPGATASTGSVSTFPGTASFSTDITSQLLTNTFLPATPTKSTTLSSSQATLAITQGTLSGATANPPAAQITSPASSSSSYTVTRTLEALAVRQGGTSGAASTSGEMHSDGQQADFTSTAGCRTCTTSNPVVSLSAGDSHACLVESNGNTKCWGNSNEGRLGIGSSPSHALMPTSINKTNISSFTHTQVAAGKDFTCLLGSTSNGVTCWGGNSLFQLGRGGTATSDIYTPSATVVQNLSNPVAIAASKSGGHACAINSSGNVSCWGSGTQGQLGNNSNSDNSSSAVQVVLSNGSTALPYVRSVAVGGSHTCAALSYHASYTGGIYCWGSNSNGQLGDNTTTLRTTATPVAITNQGATTSSVWFSQVVAGQSHTCALRNDGAVFCWGRNVNGQLGDNSTTQRNVPTQVNGLGASSGVVSLSAGNNHTCALKSDHSVVCWGANDSGQLGDSSITQRTTPATALSAASSTAVALSAGGRHTCVANFDGTAQCWGDGAYGKLGNNVNSTTEGASDDCDSSSEIVAYCLKSPTSVNWSSGVTSNATLRPRTCHRYAVP